MVPVGWLVVVYVASGWLGRDCGGSAPAGDGRSVSASSPFTYTMTLRITEAGLFTISSQTPHWLLIVVGFVMCGLLALMLVISRKTR